MGMKRMARLLAAGMMLLSMTACTARPAASPSPSPVSELDAHAIASLDNGPVEGGTLMLFMTSPDTLHPLRTKNHHVLQMLPFLFDSLVTVDANRNPEPLLAAQVRNVDAGRIWDVTLRDGIRFHDGSAMTISDVKYTMLALAAVGSGGTWWQAVSDLESVEMVDVRTLRIILQTPDPLYERRLTFPVLSERAYAAWPADDADITLMTEPEPVGSGAFRLESIGRDLIRLVKNEDWWNTQTGGLISHPIWIDEIHFRVFDAGADLVTAFQRQTIDVAEIHELDVDRYAQRTDLHIGKYAANQLEFAFTGSRSTFLKDAALRSTLFAYLAWMASVEPFSEGLPLMSLWTTDGTAATLEMQAALDALQAAGYRYNADKNLLMGTVAGSRRQVTVEILYNQLNVERLGIAEWIAEALSQLGILVKVTGKTEDEETQAAETGKFDLMLMGCSIPTYADTADTLPLLTGQFKGMADAPTILPLYRKQAAVLYQLRVRGDKAPLSWNLYNGWHDWYLIGTPEETGGTP